MKKSLILSTIILVSYIGIAHGKTVRSLWPFSAPSVTDPDTIDPKTKGDIVFDSSNSSFLGWDGSGWIDFSGSATTRLNVVDEDANYSADSQDDLILADAGPNGSFDVTLPDTSTVGDGKVYRIKKTDSTFDPIGVLAFSGQTINGQSGTTLNTEGETLVVVSFGTDWKILNRSIPSVWTDSGAVGLSATAGTTPAFGTTSINKIWWRRVGDSAQIKMIVRQTGAGTAGSGGDYKFSMPSGLNIDSTKVAFFTTVSSGTTHSTNQFGSAMAVTSQSCVGSIRVYDATTFRMFCLSETAGDNTLNNSFFSVGTADVMYSADFTVPISGWNN